MSDLYLFASVIAKSGLMTSLLPGIFLAVLVEAKYHRLMRWAEKFKRAFGDGQLAANSRLIPNRLSGATSPSRKTKWRVA
jgi:hypothetical protein